VLGSGDPVGCKADITRACAEDVATSEITVGSFVCEHH